MIAPLIFLSLLLGSVRGDFLQYHSFQPPFNQVDAGGNRIVNDEWRASGTTVVNNNFIRLTPDRQSKKGALWSRKAVGVPNFSTVLKFRISGQGKQFFGDGIGLWFVQQSYHIAGNVHGFMENFYGVGIIFDTFKNTENIQNHRDVTVLVNDGSKTYEMMTENVQGCNAAFRYHAERADFSVLDASRAKIVLDDQNLQVFIDPKDSGEWTPCVNVSLSLNNGWLHRSHIGITATTGQLADNHDILYLKSFSDATTLDHVESDDASKKSFVLEDFLPADTKLKKVEQIINSIIDDHDTLDHHVEHQLASVMDHIKSLIGKIEKREDKSETRIENLEKLIKQEVEGSLEKRLSALELQMKGNVERKMFNIETALDRKMNNLETKTSELTKTDAGDWRLPFVILLLVVVAAAIGLYLFYLKMKKMHIL